MYGYELLSIRAAGFFNCQNLASLRLVQSTDTRYQIVELALSRTKDHLTTRFRYIPVHFALGQFMVFCKLCSSILQACDQLCPAFCRCPVSCFLFFLPGLPVSFLLLVGIFTWNFETQEFKIDLLLVMVHSTN